MKIHPSAVVSPGALLGDDVSLGPNCFIDEQVQLGNGCTVGPNAVILGHTSLGEHCQVHAGAVIGDVPQDLAYRGGISFVEVGSDCVIREGATIHRGTDPGSTTKVGHHCMLMANSHLGHNVYLGDGVIVSNGALVAGHAHLEDHVIISGNCLVHQHTRIGRLAMLSGGSGTQMDVPPFCITRSLASNTVMNLNVIGLRRAGIDVDGRRALKTAFDALYRSNLSISAAIGQIEQSEMHPLVKEFCQFIKQSKRGICKFFREEQAETDSAAADDDQPSTIPFRRAA